MTATTAAPALVFVLLKSDGVGGVERHISTLVPILERHGAATKVISFGPSTTTPGILAHHDVTVLDPRVGRGPLRRLLQLVALRKLQRKLAPDAVVAFGPSANAIAALASRRGIRTVIAEVGNPFIPRRRRWNRWWMWSYRRADALVLQTERLASEMRPRRARPRDIHVIPNMVPPAVPFVPPGSDRDRVVAGVGRFVPIKRYGDLLEAFARVGPAADGWRVLLVGDGDERERWSDIAERLGIADRVEMPGVHEAPWELLARASVFVLCSEREGFPMVLLEAMASGCAVVSSDCRFGPRDVLAPSGAEAAAGLLYPVGDVDALSEHLRTVMGDAELRSRLAQRSARRAADFTAHTIGPAWAAVLGLDQRVAAPVGPTEGTPGTVEP